MSLFGSVHKRVCVYVYLVNEYAFMFVFVWLSVCVCGYMRLSDLCMYLCECVHE